MFAASIPLVCLLAGGLGYLAGHYSKGGRNDWIPFDGGPAKTIRGNWGEIHYWDTILEMPANLISRWSAPTGVTQWYVGTGSPQETVALLRSCGLGEAQAGQLVATARDVEGGGFVLEPSDRFILSLDADQRAKLYGQLASWSPNTAIADPTRFQKIGSLDWLDAAQLPRDVAQTVQKLIYRRGDTQLFVDYDVVLRTIPDNRVARHFIRTMTRQNCYMGAVIVRPDSDIDAMTAYWGRGGRESEVRTLLESANAANSRKEVPILMLLPQFVRDRLYRYRRATDPEKPNCHYTAMNFFNDKPDDTLTDLGICSRLVDSDYAPVSGPDYLLGDVILFMANERHVVHSCNVVAGNIVFTKNGYSVGQPWVLTDLNELRNYFSIEQPVSLHVVRRKDMPPP